MIKIKSVNRTNEDIKKLVAKLDIELAERYGNFQREYDKFNCIGEHDSVIVACNNDIAVGCGCYKKFNQETVEIKRMFVEKEHRGKGISRLILAELENRAGIEGFKKAILETGINQPEAVSLYTLSGYERITNYRQYKGMDNSICMLKELKYQ